MTIEQTRANLVSLRERYVRLYTNHLSALSSLLIRTALSSGRHYLDARTISRDLMEYTNSFAHQIEGLRSSLIGVVVTAAGREDDTLRDFAHSLADETIESILSQVRIDTHRARRLGVELAMRVLHEAPKTDEAYRAVASHFLQKNLYRLDSRGRHLKSERFVRATLSIAIFRAYNESFVYAHSDPILLLDRPGHPMQSFPRDEYEQVVAELHPFAEPIVWVDVSVTHDV
jgi:hypothetical protein